MKQSYAMIVVTVGMALGRVMTALVIVALPYVYNISCVGMKKSDIRQRGFNVTMRERCAGLRHVAFKIMLFASPERRDDVAIK